MSTKRSGCEAPRLQNDVDQKLRRYCDCDMTQPELHEFVGGRAVVFSSRYPGGEVSNGDAAALIPFSSDAGILAVADGVGSCRSADQASQLVIESLIESFQKTFGFTDAVSLDGTCVDSVMSRIAILNGIEDANQKLLGQGQGAASTLAVVEVQGSTIRTYHVGDSAIIVAGQRRKIKLQTVSHSPVGFAIESGMLNEAEAMHHEDRHFVSNVVGKADMRIEIGSPLTLAPRDTLLLASDGLFDNLHVNEIVERMCVGPLDTAIHRIADESIHRMNHPDGDHPSKPDDLTIVAFRLNPKRKPRATRGSDGPPSNL